MRVVVVALIALLAGGGPLAALPDTPENRERLAAELQALQRSAAVLHDTLASVFGGKTA